MIRRESNIQEFLLLLFDPIVHPEIGLQLILTRTNCLMHFLLSSRLIEVKTLSS